MSGSSMQTSSNRSQTPASRQRMKRRCVLLHPPYSGGKSRHGAPVRKIQKTALTNFRLSLAIPPHVPRLPGRCGSIFAHIASERSWRWRALVLLVLRFVFMPFSFTKTGTSCNTNLVTTHSNPPPVPPARVSFPATSPRRRLRPATAGNPSDRRGESCTSNPSRRATG